MGALVGAVLGVLVPAAWAGWSYSSWQDLTSNGVAYQNRASITTDSSQLAGTSIRRTNGGDAGINKMGARARVFFQSGVLCADTNMSYNTSAASGWSQYLAHTCGGTIFSKGATNTWNGSGYDWNATYQTVYVG